MWIHWIQLLSLFVEGKKIGELLPFVKWGYVYIPTMVEERIKWNYIWQIQKGKMVVWGGLTKSWEKKRSEVKGKGKMERYTHLNAEFQRIASRDKKAFLSDAVKALHSICQQIWNTQQWLQDWKRSVFIHSFHSNPKERQGQRRFKLPHNCTHLTC